MQTARCVRNYLNPSVSRVADWRKRSRIILSLLASAILSMLLTTSQAQTNYQRILAFGPLPQSGSSPRAQLMEGSDGFLYGTTYTGGASNSGTIFKIKKDGSGLAQIYSFTNSDFPLGGLVEATNGALCGTTSGGGANGAGTVFRCNKDGSGFTLLHVFPTGNGDGTVPVCGLIRGNNGILYGTTAGGGVSNVGTVFRLSSAGVSYTNLHSFTGGTNGSSPAAAVYQGLDGALYGTTQAGGTSNFGTVFKMNANGSAYSILHRFTGGTNDGRVAYGGLVQASGGVLCGTTYYGGAADSGTIFKVNTNGLNYVVLRSFTSGGERQPFSGLVASSNILYGTTRYGGTLDGGTVFRVNTDGTGYTVLHRFSSIEGDGSQPQAPVLIGTDGALYGSTWGGGYAMNGVSGTLFKLFSTQPRVVIKSGTPSSSGFLISVTGGAAAATYKILATTNPSTPASWLTIGSNTAAVDGAFQFLDRSATNMPRRFYRSASQ